MLEFLDSPTIVSALAAGAAFGFVGLTRSFDAIVFAVPFCIQFIRTARRPNYVNAPFIIAGGLPFLAVLLITQYAVTGSALTAVTSWGYPKFKLRPLSHRPVGQPKHTFATNMLCCLQHLGPSALDFLDYGPWISGRNHLENQVPANIASGYDCSLGSDLLSPLCGSRPQSMGAAQVLDRIAVVSLVLVLTPARDTV